MWPTLWTKAAPVASQTCRIMASRSRRSPATSRTLSSSLDRPLDQLDPVEKAILLVGVYELRDRLEVPFRVVINEGVELAKRFGGTEGHKYVNAVLDRAAAELRAPEYRARRMDRDG